MPSLVPLYLIVDINQTLNVKIITLFHALMRKTNIEISLQNFNGTTRMKEMSPYYVPNNSWAIQDFTYSNYLTSRTKTVKLTVNAY